MLFSSILDSKAIWFEDGDEYLKYMYMFFKSGPDLDQKLNELVQAKFEEVYKKVLLQKSQMNTKQWYSPSEACVYLGIGSKTTLRKLADIAGIKPHKLSRKMVRYHRQDLDKIVLRNSLIDK